MYNDNNNFNNNQMNNFGSQSTGGYPPVQDPNVMTAFGTQPNYSQIDNNQVGMQPTVTDPSMTTAFGTQPNFSQFDNNQAGMQPTVTDPSMTTAFGTQPNFSQVDNNVAGMQPTVTDPSMTTAFGTQPNFSQVDNNQAGMQPTVTDPSMTTAFGTQPNFSQVDNNQAGMQPTVTDPSMTTAFGTQPNFSQVDNNMAAMPQPQEMITPAPQQEMVNQPSMGIQEQPMMNQPDMNYNQPMGEAPMMDNGYNNMAVGMQQDYNNFNQPSFNPEPQPNFNEQPNFVPPQYGKQNKDTSGIKFLIGFVIFVGAIVVAAVIYWPKISAKMKLKGTWVCSDGINYTFNNDKTFEIEQSYLGSTVKYKGTYKALSAKVEDEYKKYAKDGYNYLKVNVSIESQEYLNNTSDYKKDGAIAFGIKGDDAHIMKDDGTGITCHKK